MPGPQLLGKRPFTLTARANNVRHYIYGKMGAAPQDVKK